MADKMKESTNSKLENFIFKNRKAIIGVAGAAVVAAVAVCAVVGVADTQAKKGLAAVNKIEFEYSAKSTGLTDAEIASRQDKALAEIAELCGKSGIVGVRANMLCADVNFAKKNYSDALNAYVAAAEKGKKFYTAGICRYNAAVCLEELGKNEEAVKAYVEAAETKDFLLAAHAYFNAARLQETTGHVEEAAETYKKVVENYGNDPWASLSQSRLIDIQSKK